MSKLLLPLAALLLVFVQLSAAGYDQWIDLKITNRGEAPLKITGALSWGKWYQAGDKSKPANAPNVVLEKGKSTRVAACGRSDSPSGTEGEIFIARQSKRVVTVNFDVPFMGSNLFKTVVHDDETTSTNAPNWSTSGALGEMLLYVYEH